MVELREQVRAEKLDRLASTHEIEAKLAAADERTKALQAQVDELKQRASDDEHRRMQRMGDAEAAHIIIRNTRSVAANTGGGGRGGHGNARPRRDLH